MGIQNQINVFLYFNPTTHERMDEPNHSAKWTNFASYSSIVSSQTKYIKTDITSSINPQPPPSLPPSLPYSQPQTQPQSAHINQTNNPVFCNNCGKYGHMSYQCNTPITSIGIIAFRYCPEVNSQGEKKRKREYLIIRRKDTLGYIDFIRGKYSVYNKQYILNMFKQMSNEERQRILKYAREENTQDYGFKLWKQLWTNENVPITPFCNASSYKTDAKYFKPTEEKISKDKFTILANGRGMGKGKHPFHLQTFVDECKHYPEWSWDEPEWGFPKGRRDTEETDWVCALREFKEETGQPSDGTMDLYDGSDNIIPPPLLPPPPGLKIPEHLHFKPSNNGGGKYALRPQSSLSHPVPVEIPLSEKKIKPISNLFPFEENFLGSNYKPYKHKYYLMQMDYEDSDITFRSTEVSKVAWKTYEECMEIFRFYNEEKKQMLTKVHHLLEHFTLV